MPARVYIEFVVVCLEVDAGSVSASSELNQPGICYILVNQHVPGVFALCKVFMPGT